MAYKGKIDPSILKNPQKYVGDLGQIVYRSLWESQVCTWADDNSMVVKWGI